jgi:hypothetical protein
MFMDWPVTAPASQAIGTSSALARTRAPTAEDVDSPVRRQVRAAPSPRPSRHPPTPKPTPRPTRDRRRTRHPPRLQNPHPRRPRSRRQPRPRTHPHPDPGTDADPQPTPTPTPDAPPIGLRVVERQSSQSLLDMIVTGVTGFFFGA